MAAVRDFEELAIFQKARELSKKITQSLKEGSSNVILALYSRSVLPQAL